ncbi:Glycine cleavage system transcriptional activator GcvA (plasmid) [Klebsiella aerogenes]|nr:Glycine cleavage system transcriptional activator GcvA [Klebsiella aerogenes]
MAQIKKTNRLTVVSYLLKLVNISVRITMSKRLPPLNALRVFDAAARHLSFTRAADELFVTQAAVSHQIKSLEDFLGLKLFRRRNRSLLLTEEGQSYFQDIKEIFFAAHRSHA